MFGRKVSSSSAADQTSSPAVTTTVMDSSSLTNSESNSLTNNATVAVAGAVKDSTAIEPVESTVTQCSSVIKKNSYFVAEQVTKSEILWALKVVSSHYSYNSSNNMKELMCHMFPDSNIARSITIGSTKVAYVISFGLGPYFRSQLISALNGCSEYVVCFDEALNRVIQCGQMDLVLRYWDAETHMVSSRYLNSVFLGHATASDLLTKFTECLGSLPLGKIMQVSMDGLSVKWRFLEDLKKDLHQHKEDRQLLEIGSCELHVVHGAFQSGHTATGSKVNAVLRAMHNMFKDIPARRADYITVTGSNKFALKFCQVRWVENHDVAKRALKVFDDLKKYMKEKSKSGNFIFPKLWEPCIYITI